jgi:DNA adenine methylase (dam)
MHKNQLVAPVVKWVGGKRQLIDSLMEILPPKKSPYCEPFVGGGALLFKLQPTTAYINDTNEELINLYEIIRDDVDSLISELENHKNTSEYFYSVRDWDRNESKYNKLSKVKKAARVIYLNKTCYNGLFRVNNAGEFNVPFGYYKSPNFVNAPVLKAVHSYLNSAKIRITCGDYYDMVTKLPRGSFVYFDPPYDPVSSTANFTGYTKGGFSKEEQIRLKECCDELTNRNIKFMLSNSSTDFIKNLYNNYNITTVKAKRAINSNSSKRGEIDEVVVRNYE